MIDEGAHFQQISFSNTNNLKNPVPENSFDKMNTTNILSLLYTDRCPSPTNIDGNHWAITRRLTGNLE